MIRPRSLCSAIGRRCVVSGLFAAVLACAALPADAQAEAAAARAEALETEGKALRAEAEATYEAAVPGCYDKFFVNHCIDQARKKRLATVQRARALEAESRRITLAERQRVAAEAGAKAKRPVTPAAAVSAPPADAPAAPSTEAERIRAEREATTRAAEAAAARSRATTDAQRAADRRQAEEDAANRAQEAAQDRARYDERIRKYEEEQAQKKR